MKKGCSLKLDRYLDKNNIYRDLRTKLDKSPTEVESIEIYKIRISKYDFWAILKYLYKVSFLTALDIYKDYFKMPSQIFWVTVCKKCPSSLFSLKKLLRLYAKGFVTKELLDLHYWWTKELCSQQPLQVAGVSYVLRFVHH